MLFQEFEISNCILHHDDILNGYAFYSEVNLRIFHTLGNYLPNLFFDFLAEVVLPIKNNNNYYEEEEEK